MRALTFWRTVVADETGFLGRIMQLLDEHEIRHCVLGGQGVNAYVEPVVSLDLDLVVAVDQIEKARELFSRQFTAVQFPHSINVTGPGSDLRLQIQTDPRYGAFVDRATRRSVLGLEMRVAHVEDVLQGKVWAALDPERRASKRQKDLADIARLVEAYPHLRATLPIEIANRLV
jgi:hypothetical protein